MFDYAKEAKMENKMLDTYAFAHLIGFVARMMNQSPQKSEVVDLHALVTDCLPDQHIIRCDDTMLHVLLESIQAGKKIDAIRAHRSLTGYGLKESKDAVEKYWFTRQQD